jgi:D-alanine--poly(phosphoribitol) ligase subunit 1
VRFDLAQGRFVDAEFARERPAIDDESRRLDWGEFERAVMRWVDRARGQGVAKDVPLIVHGHKEAEFFIAMTGCLMIRAPFVPIDTIYPDARVERIKRISGAQCVYDTKRDQFTAIDTAVPSTPKVAAQEGLAYIMFTSGSTGEPKGVQIGRESVVALVDWMRLFGLGEAPVFMNQSVFSFDLSMYEVMASLAMGGCCIMNSRDTTSDPARFLRRQSESRISAWVSTPSFAYQQLLNKEFCADYLPTLQTFLFCGEPLANAVAKRLRERFPNSRILNTYGPTEATVATTWIEVDDKLLVKHNPLPVGYCKPDGQIFLDAETQEICIAGRHVMRGYLNRPDLNASKLFEYRGERAFRTGDLGEIHDDGLIFCRGRIDDQIKLNGFRIELAEIDSALRGLDGVASAAVIALRHHDGTVARLVGFIVPEPQLSRTPEFPAACKAALAKLLPVYMIPSELVLSAELPLSVNLKVDRKRLAERYQQSAQSKS